jgi:hypothetical protein
MAMCQETDTGWTFAYSLSMSNTCNTVLLLVVQVIRKLGYHLAVHSRRTSCNLDEYDTVLCTCTRSCTSSTCTKYVHVFVLQLQWLLLHGACHRCGRYCTIVQVRRTTHTHTHRCSTLGTRVLVHVRVLKASTAFLALLNTTPITILIGK